MCRNSPFEPPHPRKFPVLRDPAVHLATYAATPSPTHRNSIGIRLGITTMGTRIVICDSPFEPRPQFESDHTLPTVTVCEEGVRAR